MIDAVGAGNPVGVAEALINAPGVIFDGLVNGTSTPFFGILSGGILNPGAVNGGEPPTTFGPIAAIHDVLVQIAAAMAPQAMAFASVTSTDLTNKKLVKVNTTSDLQTATGADVKDQSGQQETDTSTTGSEGSTSGTVSTTETTTENDGNPATTPGGSTDNASGATDLSSGNKVTPTHAAKKDGPIGAAVRAVNQQFKAFVNRVTGHTGAKTSGAKTSGDTSSDAAGSANDSAGDGGGSGS